MIWYTPDHIEGGFLVKVQETPFTLYECCQYNCEYYTKFFEGDIVEGFYVVKHIDLEIYQFVRHFVIRNKESLVDITPFRDNRTYNLFVPSPLNMPNKLTRFPKYEKTKEPKLMYYVYAYIDPITDQPFYVGKGKQNRSTIHITESQRPRKNKNTTRFLNKLESMICRGIEPKVIFLAQNIEDESIAYDIEEHYIKMYGRRGYDDGGVLLNICEGARPPNHKGKTYQDIYGDRAQEEIEKRRKTQIDRGGFGPKVQSLETRAKISLKTSGKNNPRFGAIMTPEIRNKISKANKGKRRLNAFEYIFTDNAGKVYNIKGSTEAIAFCSYMGLSWSTFNTAARLGWPAAKRGKNVGWTMIIKR